MIFVLIISVAILLLLACFAVRNRRVKVDVEPFSQDDVDVMGQVVPGMTNPTADSGIDLKDLTEGDMVYFTTESGSKYRFSLLDPDTGLFCVKAARTKGDLSFIEEDVVMRARFMKGRPVVFWTMDFRKVTTTPVTWLLVA